MDKKWLEKYYKSLGWSEHRIADFLRRATVLEKVKEDEVKQHIAGAEAKPP
jgi:hypothetical protein